MHFFAYVNYTRLRSWNQPVLSNYSKVSKFEFSCDFVSFLSFEVRCFCKMVDLYFIDTCSYIELTS